MNKLVYNCVTYLRKIPGWLIMVEEYYGKDVADACEQAHDDILSVLHTEKMNFYLDTRPAVRKGIKEWVAVESAFSDECRLRRRKEQEDLIKNASDKLEELFTHRGNIEKKREMVDSLNKLKRKFASKITPEEIKRAQEYPLENLLTINRGMALCIEHDDHYPSMNCKNNYCYCHTCGFHADPIGVYMKLNNCGFKEAVKSLI